jgi:putative transposase
VSVFPWGQQGRLVGRRRRIAGAGVVGVLMLYVMPVTAVHAQQVFYSGVEPLSATIGRYQSDPRPTSTDGKLPIFDWLLSGSVGWGGAYDSNVNATPINRQSVYGASFQPSLWSSPRKVVRPMLVSQGQTDAIRQIGVSEVTYYRWRQEYGGLKTDQVKRLKELEQENSRLRRAVSDLTLDKLILQEAARGNF